MKRWKLCLLLLLSWAGYCSPAAAEGSRNLYSNSPATSFRANTEWRNDFYGGIVKRRTLLKVYAQQGEYILMGSSAVGVTKTQTAPAPATKGDIWLYKPNTVTGQIGNESIPSTPEFKCTSQTGTNQGKITSRTQEKDGPRTIDPVTLPNIYGNSTGYIPCYYQAPETGIYDIVFMGPEGFTTTFDGSPTGQLNLANANNFNANQNSSVAAWDVTVRSSKTSTSDINGRLFTYYLALFTAGNGRPIYSTIYPVTTDGYQYETAIRGLDPNGFVLYGNEVGFFDSNGTSTLYHNVVGSDAQLTNRDGNTSLSRPQFPIFFSTPDPIAFPDIKIYDRNGANIGTGLPAAAILPSISNVSFSGNLTGNSSQIGQGGNINFTTSSRGRYQIIIKGSGSSDFEALNPVNRFIQGDFTSSGTYSIPWDGKDNAGNNFPVGNGYEFQIRVLGGEYHFPMLDAENNFSGGPTIKLLNAPASYPTDPPSFGVYTAFYDDRVYKTKNGTIVHVGATQTNIDNNDPICGVGAPVITFSDPVKGFDSRDNDRKFGQSSGGNANNRCSTTGSFGDTKGLDMWTFFPGGYELNVLNILPFPTKMLLVKRITAININTGATVNGDDMSLFNRPLAKVI